MILLDTHTLVWWTSDQEKLSAKARHAIDQAQAKKAIYLSAISCWEIAMLVHKGRLNFNIPLQEWFNSVYQLESLTILPVDHIIAVSSVTELHINHQDPADRIILATTIQHHLKLITKEPVLQANSQVTTIW